MASYRDQDGRFPRYVSVRERRAAALRASGQLEKRGHKLEPIVLEGAKIAHSFWGKAWCKNLEAYGDFANRLPRGRSYLRHGAVIDLRIAKGHAFAKVKGTRLYDVTVEIEPLSKRRLEGLTALCQGQIDSMVALLRGDLPEALVAAMVEPESGLFPEPDQLRFNCSCPDSAALCKHIAATLYGIGARFDRKPETFFTLRSVEVQELLAQGVAAAPKRGAQAKAGALEKLFGIELEPLPKPARPRRPRQEPSPA